MSSSNFITIKYFAGLRERLDFAHESLSVPQGLTLAGLQSHLMERNQLWHDAFDQTAGLRASINHEIAPFSRVLANGDEVAFFPPVTGG
jgi:molybdopterin synthase sulfur carrier subunit